MLRQASHSNIFYVSIPDTAEKADTGIGATYSHYRGHMYMYENLSTEFRTKWATALASSAHVQPHDGVLTSPTV